MDRRAADQGDLGAMDRLGVLYFFGVGVAADRRKARELFTRTAEKGLANAQLQLLRGSAGVRAPKSGLSPLSD